MLKESCLCLLFFLAFCSNGSAQQLLFGKITKMGTEEPLTGVNVANIGQKLNNVSDRGGNFKIPAMPGDSLIISSAGYLPDTTIVKFSMFSDNCAVVLTPNIITLPYVKVDQMEFYQADSIKRREEYRFILDKKHPVKLWNAKRQGDDPGLSFSPIGYFSTNQTQKRKLKKRLLQEEEDYYVDYKFSYSRVAQLTKLKGDSLKIFMLRYRPSYSFCRNANNQDVFLYINDKLKIFRKDKL